MFAHLSFEFIIIYLLSYAYKKAAAVAARSPLLRVINTAAATVTVTGTETLNGTHPPARIKRVTDTPAAAKRKTVIDTLAAGVCVCVCVCVCCSYILVGHTCMYFTCTPTLYTPQQ
jgi:hypothetical protein